MRVSPIGPAKVTEVVIFVSQHTSVREMVIERLTSSFGRPSKINEDYRWSVNIGPAGEPRAHPPVNIAIDCWNKANEVRVWVFDPRQADLLNRAQSMAVSEVAQVELVMQRLHQLINGPS